MNLRRLTVEDAHSRGKLCVDCLPFPLHEGNFEQWVRHVNRPHKEDLV